jgi:hypothetical protein
MQVNDRIRLLKRIDVCDPGDEGDVLDIDSRGLLAVGITHRADCTPFSFTLFGVRPDQVAAGGHCRGAAAPAGMVARSSTAAGRGARRTGTRTGAAKPRRAGAPKRSTPKRSGSKSPKRARRPRSGR